MVVMAATVPSDGIHAIRKVRWMMESHGYCCDRFRMECTTHQAWVGGGFGAYPADMEPTGQIEKDDDGGYAINGCCGGGCYVLTGVKYCPFCGSKLAET